MTIFTFGWFSILIQRKYISSTSGILWTIFHFSESVCWCCFGCDVCDVCDGIFNQVAAGGSLQNVLCGRLAGRNESCLAQRRMSGKWIGYLWATFFAILNLQLGLMYQGNLLGAPELKYYPVLCILFISTRAHYYNIPSEIWRRRSICKLVS